ncbi:MAG: 23S rRNA (uracil(1939)-C(5))-methyltransferase RlmD [Thalassolituus sp.]
MKQTGSGRTISVTIDNLNSDGQGVARSGRDIYFVPGALPGETVTARMVQRSKKIWHTRLVSVENASPDRNEPACPHYQRCGGCDLQHMTYSAQVAFKQARVERELQRQKVQVEQWVGPITGPEWNYRRKARIGVRFSKEQQQNFVGFREGGSKHITDIDRCAVLPDNPALDWAQWRDLIGELNAASLITQIEPVIADNALLFLLRVLKPLQDDDVDRLSAQFSEWAETSDRPLQLWIRTEKGAAPEAIWPATGSEAIWHEVEGLRLQIRPDDFIQVNRTVNRAMVAQALDWLSPADDEHIWDLFAGHGNFSMPLAVRSRHVTAIEGQASMTDSLREQAEKLALPLQAICADLAVDGTLSALPAPDAVLLDPPRAGAAAVMPELIRRRVARVLYVSCDAATLARDLSELVTAGYKVVNAGIMDMFPQTHHVETMVMLEYRGK